MARHNLIRFGVLLFLIALSALETQSTLADQPPRVFAFYYAWFDENSWTPDHVADIPAETYVSRDPNAIARQIDQAQGAGIDSFVVSWLGPGNPTDERFKMMLDIAGGKNFSATIDFEANRYASRDALVNWAQIRAQVDPNHDQIWIAEGVNIGYQRVFDGHHLYSIAWSPDVNYTLNDWAKRVRRAGAEKLWVATVMPGYDDTRTSRADKFARTRDDGAF